MERAIADHLATRLGSPAVDRLVKTGAADRGDIGNVRDSHGRLLAIEVKNTARLELPKWVGEAHREAENYGAHVGVVVSKRHGVSAPGEQWVHMTVDDLVKLLRQGDSSCP